MTTNELAGFLFCLGDAFLLIVYVLAACYYSYSQRREDDNNRRQDAPRAQPAPAVQMAAAMALVTYPHRQTNDAAAVSSSSTSAAAAAGGNHLSSAEECAICLGQFEDGDWCSVMPGCRHEFHHNCIAKWLTMACNNNSCPLCRAQLQWPAVAHDMV